MESYEVVIVGAGPGGLACARKLSEAGKKVLLLEKNSVIGPKVCGGGVTGKNVDYLNLPEELVDCKLDEISIHTPLQKISVRPKNFFVYTVDRKNLGQWQLGNLKNNSVVIRTNSRVTKIFKDHIVIDNSEKIGFEYLVGADGSVSMVRNFLGLKTKDLLVAIQYIVPGENYKKLEMFFDSDLFGLGYAWIFPHKGYASIGCGCPPQFFSPKKLMKNFAKWLEINKIDTSRGKYEAFPINYDFQGYKFGNIFLIGDAAGLASGLTGGGIYQAIISGEEVAKSICDKNYVSEKIAEAIKKKPMQKRVLQFLGYSGTFRKIEFEILGLLMKNQWTINHLNAVL